jgi:uncharacterized protein (TIGR00730 family)
MGIQSIAVFCGSQFGNNPLFAAHTATLGGELARLGIRLIYGGGSNGLMGVIANSVLAQGGYVTGVIPQRLVDLEKQHQGLTETIVTPDMHTRKKIMYERCDAAIILPGGYGTMDELFEMLTWNQLKIHDKKIFILNTAGYYSSLIGYFHQGEQESFFYEPVHTRLTVCSSPEELIDMIVATKTNGHAVD